MSDSHPKKESSLNETSDSDLNKISDNHKSSIHDDDDISDANEDVITSNTSNIFKNTNLNVNVNDEETVLMSSTTTTKLEDEDELKKKKKKKDLSSIPQVSTSNNALISSMPVASEGLFNLPRQQQGHLRSSDEKRRSAFNRIAAFLFKSGKLQKKEFDGLLASAKNIKVNLIQFNFNFNFK